MNRPAAFIAVIFLSIIAIGQLIRFVFQISLVVGGLDIPAWPSAIAFLIAGSLAFWLSKERRRAA